MKTYKQETHTHSHTLGDIGPITRLNVKKKSSENNSQVTKNCLIKGKAGNNFKGKRGEKSEEKDGNNNILLEKKTMETIGEWKKEMMIKWNHTNNEEWRTETIIMENKWKQIVKEKMKKKGNVKRETTSEKEKHREKNTIFKGNRNNSWKKFWQL